MTHTTITCTCTLVSEDQRMAVVDRLFGISYVLALEPTVFTMAERLASDYTGGNWSFYELTNGGFYMAPQSESGFKVVSENGYQGMLSADALGITACLYAYSELSFQRNRLAQICAEQYHLLREWLAEHPEARAIYAAID